jgi:spore maturation protein CgeB
LPPATFDQIDLSSDLNNTETDWDLLVYGIEHPDSIQILDELQDVIKPYSTLVIGSNLPESIRASFSYQPVGSHAELISITRRSRIVFNLSSCINLCNSIYEIVPSTPHSSIFELAALNVCQLVFFRHLEIYSYFTKDEILTFSYKLEFAELLQRYSQDSQLRHSQANKAWQRVLQDHLYRHRFQKLISYISN